MDAEASDTHFFAHSTLKADRSDWQPLVEHLQAVARLAGEKAAFFGGGELAALAGLLHDLGKYTDEFQRRIAGDAIRVDHTTRGAMLAVERYGALGQLLAYGIAGHHTGLANGREAGERTALVDRLKGIGLPRLLEAWCVEIVLPERLQPPPLKTRPERGFFQLAFLGRMLFSCLVDADYLDTEAFYHRVEGRRSLREQARPSLAELRAALDRHLTEFKGDTPVNRLRGEILAGVRGKANELPGLFSLTVPTGGGKTLASLAFALDHALAHGLRRVIYVIPFTSIVEQNAAVFRRALGALGEEAVLEHHSAFVDDHRQSLEAKKKLNLAMENWDAPIVVTTAVQFFESLFADRPAQCRKLHNIAGSVVILDEAQTLPLKLLRPCVAALDELALNYRCSPVLCTATQPALQSPDFIGGLQDVRELAPEPQRLYRELERVRVRALGPLEDAALTEQIAKREQVLCIVNNRRHARALYESLAGLPGARHLTTLMCAKHRSNVLAEVRQMLKTGESCRLVATSLIEAGVDVDFPVVLRAEAGLDSIAQAAGRCNREGKRPLAESEVLVFAAANSDWAPPEELKQFAQAAREVMRLHPDDCLSMAAIERYFRLLYWQKGAEELDAGNLLGLIERGRLDGLPYETLATKFRMIDSLQLPVIVPFDDEARAALRELEFAEGCAAIARRLQPYLVQMPRKGYQALLDAGAIQAAAGARYGEQFMTLVNPDLYHHQFGLHWDNPAFVSSERLCW
ncbi:TPA: CRISPR-associated helicase/endonuclease Cas3 [Pseudomonas aeruginosa]|uniref:CRISPR-associated helicase/endonuclease Cas3 n=1 Tax=Pseudomonas TaxID=286 RepID=UPI0003B99847|nr:MULTISPECIES: CRISPR-associated helicase/endonuclease Cas3 [Pseudomonas]EKV6259720.1 CRISPR-associated helicase/endonuclease Cas3 [Pseudomonas aeruginosa]ERV60146.1 CRISPR-associated endonuclease cas3-hd [Pseudomonas aeruginosa BL07]MBG7167529.1 CRISPR-associated helicase/endonuclease Cas3 [Pseudomonas aeruginosa]MBH8778583.1 CRISPR-associated helicase/endonuclease Cas3 [Pseudomonas aeruginosa]MBI8896426.1 CRISPR-associated helicase/endonuclease Cas3 [Pseudomonas aeruginosa]